MGNNRENYAILDQKPLGIGGQAEVYKAKNKQSGADVALKRIKPSLRHDRSAVARMRREIEVQTSLQHKHIMPILDHSQKFYWYTMPIAEKSLRNTILPVENQTLIEIMDACANGLIVAHQNGYIHRDVNPNNILLITDGDEKRWVVADWGLVRKHGQTTNVYTSIGREFGTAGFAAPETWDDAHNVDERADVYGLGRIAAWCLTGIWPSPNIPLLPKGIWYEFIQDTTNINVKYRTKDMSSVLELITKIKNQKEEPKIQIDQDEINLNTDYQKSEMNIKVAVISRKDLSRKLRVHFNEITAVIKFQVEYSSFGINEYISVLVNDEIVYKGNRKRILEFVIGLYNNKELPARIEFKLNEPTGLFLPKLKNFSLIINDVTVYSE